MKATIYEAISFFLLLILSEVTLAENRGIYIWAQSFYTHGIEKTIQHLKENKITDIYILVKGEAGYTIFPSNYSYKDHFKASADSLNQKTQAEYEFMSDPLLLNKIIDQAHKNYIRIHAWFIISGDKHFVESTPGSEVVQIQNPEKSTILKPVYDKGHINLLNPLYKEYIFSLIEKALEYPFDGLMLDKIRYTSLTYSFDDLHISKALRAGIDVDKVIKCAIKSSYGKEDEKNLFIDMYKEYDKDIRAWIELKKEDILDYVKQARELTKKKNITLSASLMPEGAYDDAFSDINYAQNYAELSAFLDYIVIMAYPQAFSQPAEWIKMVTANAKTKSFCKVWTAIQGYDNVTPEFVYDQVISSRIVNSDGIAVFRLGGMSPEMWNSFNSAMEYNISEVIKSQKKGIIYSGQGTAINSSMKSAEALLKSKNIIPLLKEYNLDDKNVFNNIDFILIPGGRATAIAKALGTASLHNIRDFIASGGGYVGICAGSYLPVKGYNVLTSELEIVNAEVKDVDHWNRGEGTAQLEASKNHPVFRSIKDKLFELKYFSGPILIPSPLNLSSFKILAYFKTDFHDNGAIEGEMINTPAIVEAKYKKGKILLFSPHPELTPGREELLVDAVLYVAKKK